MSQRTATFAPNDVTIIITHNASGIVHQLAGFSEDSIITIERNSPTYELYTGADDTNTRIYKANTSAKLTIPLAQSSNSNDILSGLYGYDKSTRNSKGMFTIVVKDNSGRSSFFSDESYIAVVPNSQFGNSMQTREWVIDAVKTSDFIGGNSILSVEDQATLESLGITVDPQWI